MLTNKADEAKILDTRRPIANLKAPPNGQKAITQRTVSIGILPRTIGGRWLSWSIMAAGKKSVRIGRTS